ncbi:M17 family metallopeptidase [uncultured Georgenia sp.]|uniref:leucyl aminopeptidase family protein n=1 Tax=uncultured Georgenia sp. TaxID=378209 RepID=UPI002628EC39|nr:leucyl aminopeptidase family protein [uncultured Georgenia sp.]HLV05746.1 leucyl aminopeptidase family protein [Actinomycetaceae bacterium]
MTTLDELGLTELPEVLGEAGSVGSDDRWVPRADALVVAVAPPTSGEEGVDPRPGTADAAARYGIDLVDLAARHGLSGKAGETAVLDLPRPLPGRDFGWGGLPRRLVLVGVGDAGPDAMRKVGSALCRTTTGLGTVVTPVGTLAGRTGLAALLEGFWLTAYRGPRRAQSPRPGKAPAERLVLLGNDADGEVVAAARAAATATVRARFLAATPSNVKNPQWLAERAVELAATVPGVTAEVRDEAWLREQGMGAVLAVGSGSATPPRLVTLTYTPRQARGARTVALVGKGITFDTGGISIKPRDAMVGMKTDMAGAAAVLATVLAAAEMRLPHRIVGVLALAENAVGASSYRPGDVVRAYDGTTIEVSNTDAEGRMVLADAMAWVRQTARPDVLVDVATLTGAVTLGLGRTHAGLYATDDALAAALEAAGEVSGERVWRLPLVESYRPSLDSDVADISHQSRDPHIMGGSITAALFLQHFAGDVPWAHLDIAGAGRATKARDEVPEGPTGFGARLLLRWLADLR